MSSIGSPSPFLFGGKKSYKVSRSIRGDDLQSSPHRLTRTIQSGGNRKKFTISVWIKRSQLGNTSYSNSSGNDGQTILHTVGGGNRGWFKFDTDDTLGFDQGYDAGGSGGRLTTTAKYRDTSAWYHILAVADYANSTAADRAKVFVNGVRQAVTIDNAFTDTDGKLNDNQQHEIGYTEYGGGYTGSSWWSNLFCGYMAEYYFIDGQALDPSSFTETNAVTGQLVPKEYEGTFGTTGWYLEFKDNSAVTATTLGKDSSGNSNNWTPNGFAVSDAMPDTPTNNFATMNPLNGYTGLSEGNLRFNTYNDSSGPRSTQATIALPKSGKWYWEARYQESGTGTVTTKYFGLSQLQNTNGYLTAPYVYYDTTHIKNGNSSEDIAHGNAWYDGVGVPAILAIAVDVDNNSVKYYKDNSLQGTITLPTLTALQEYFFTWANTSGGSSSSLNDTFNFGADSTFQGQVSSGGNTDANGIGDFKYAPPAGHLALCTANLPDPTILLPNKHFDTVTYTGSGSGNQSITSLNFQPDWVWIKARSVASYHVIADSVRGVGKLLSSNDLTAETDDSTSQTAFSAFLSNGFTVGYNSGWYVNGTPSGSTPQVAWNWDAGETDSKTYTVTVVNDSGNKYRFDGYGTSAVTLDLAEGGTYTFNYPSAHPLRFSTTSDGTHGGGSEYTSGVTTYGNSITITVAANAPTLYYYCSQHSGMGGQVNTNSTLGSSNFDGSTQSIVKANQTAGFSIVTYTGKQNTSDTIGHGLGVKPQVVISKSRNATYTYTRWYVHHHALTTGYGLFLELSDASFDEGGDYYVNGSFSSTVFAVGSDAYGPNVSNNNYVAYCFSEVAGYSKFGKYTGNGSSNGTFVFTGFRPAWVMIKRIDAGDHWNMTDAKRGDTNVITETLFANLNQTESYASSYDKIDYLSNGFKPRENNSQTNASGGTYIYLAFAEAPFKYARAR